MRDYYSNKESKMKANSNIGKCIGCGDIWCDKHNQCSSLCHGNCKTVQQKETR